MSGRSLSDELVKVREELEEVESKMGALRMEKRRLMEKRANLEAALQRHHAATENGGEEKWEQEGHPWSAQLRQILKERFKHSEFRPLQLRCLNALLSGEDVICVMSTGAGKSLVAQLGALAKPGFALVVSPLVSLMEDQVGALQRLGVQAEMLHSGTPKELNSRIMNAITDGQGELKLLYVTPERLAKSKRFFSKIEKAHSLGRLNLLAIDEVHCCSQVSLSRSIFTSSRNIFYGGQYERKEFPRLER